MEEKDKPIPSPYMKEEVKDLPINPVHVKAFVDEFKRFFNARDVFIFTKTNHRHPNCGEKSCDGYTKVVFNDSFKPQELKDLADEINHLFGSNI